jgi:hypothetical protein
MFNFIQLNFFFSKKNHPLKKNQISHGNIYFIGHTVVFGVTISNRILVKPIHELDELIIH